MKKSVLTVLFALFCTMSFAQLSFNVKAGLNLSSYIGDNSDHSKFKPGVRLGVGMEYQFTATFTVFLAERCKVFGRIQRYRGC